MVKEYEIEFNRLAPYAAELVKNEESKTRFFIQGLHPSLKIFVIASQCCNFYEAVEISIELERESQEVTKARQF